MKIPDRPLVVGVVAGVVYGLTLRLAANESSPWGDTAAAMTLAFLLVVPIVIGYLTVRPHPNPSWTYRLLAPWIPIVVSVIATAVLGWEGSICIVMGLPLLLIGSSIGGVIGAARSARHRAGAGLAIIAPLLLVPAEMRVPRPVNLRVVERAIEIRATPADVWREIVSVRTIGLDEQRPALFTRLGFPRPVSATLSHEGVGGIRLARFERGILFVETVTDWEPENRLRFTIAAQTDSIPPSTLDDHVTIGGPYFDVLTGEYRIEPGPGGVTILHLRSELRVSTTFNLYASLWADAIMRSIQDNILAVIQSRAVQR